MDDDASPSGQRLGQAADGLRGAVDERELLPIPILHPLDDDPVQLLGRLREPELVVEVLRPLRGAHPHHVRLRAVVPAATALADQTLAHLVPDLLGVEEQAVEVEDDGFDHRPW